MLLVGCSQNQQAPPIYKEVLIKAVFVDRGCFAYIIEYQHKREYAYTGWTVQQENLPLVGEKWLMKDGEFVKEIQP